VGALVFLGVALTMVSPYYVAFAACYGPLARRFRITLPLLAAAAWVGADLLRGRLLTGTPFFIGNPWALLGYSQVGVAPLVQVASLAGVYGITFALVAVNVGLAEVVGIIGSRRGGARAVSAILAVASAPALGVWAYGVVALRSAPLHDVEGTEIAIVQGNLPSDTRWRSDLYGRNLETYLRLTLEALGRASPQVVFWPEAAMAFFLEDDQLYRAAVTRVLRAGAVELVAGGPTVASKEPETYYNSVFLLSAQGEVRARYDKEHLVPLAEYFPLQIDLLRRSFGRIREFSHGEATEPLPTAAGKAGILVCNEAMLPELAARRVSEGATILVNPSNDTWISDPGFVQQQFDIVSLRAIEQRRYLVRASTSGPSGIVDPWGRILARTDPGTRGSVVGRVKPLAGRSVYGRVGDLFAVSCIGATVLALLAARRRQVTSDA
jgi:apolipoprotein N-acyltransferase